MSWNFLRPQREEAVSAQQSGVKPAAPQGSIGEREVQLIKTFDDRALGVARDTVHLKLEEFEKTLQGLTDLPDQFRQVMAPVENAVNSLMLMRNRLELVEETLSGEQLKAGNLGVELSRALTDLERTQVQLRNEENLHASMRDRAASLDSALNALRVDHEDLAAKMARMEPLFRETTAERDGFRLEIRDLRADKEQISAELVASREELSNALQELGAKQNFASEQTLLSQRYLERLEEAQTTMSQLEGALASSNEKLAQVAAYLQKERNTTRTLRADNTQLLKERQDIKLQFEQEVEAARSRYRLVETMLEESRARFHEETRQLTIVRNERAQRGRDLGQMTLQIEMLRREMAELRAQANASSEALTSTGSMLANEIESRRKLELDLDMLRTENSSLLLKQKALTDSAKANVMSVTEATKEFQAKFTALRNENEKLRAEVKILRNTLAMEIEEEVESLIAPLNKENVVPSR